MSVWTPDFTTVAVKRFLSGESPTIIAKGLGITRQQLLHKMTRMKLARPAMPKGNFVLPTPNFDLNPAQKRADSARKNAVAFATAPDNAVPRRVFALEDLGPRHCHWPVGDPKKVNFTFCGRAKDETGPYCPGHTEKARSKVQLARLRA